ncbi:MAG: hypothetical protein IT368_13245, partial [Candidatus Hydrogenedentes bacterium]|nr:hypothetical protein [Candidatus Hydrogenedentota bacterium]
FGPMDDPNGDGITNAQEFADSVSPEDYHNKALMIGGTGGEGEYRGLVHVGDQDGNGRINLTELMRVIQFFNSGGFHCAASPETTEDGFAPGTGSDKSCPPHSSDYDPDGPDWTVSLTELMRLTVFFNSGGYYGCPDEGTEDGFCVCPMLQSP